MTEDNDTTWPDAATKDSRAFAPSEMVACSGCSRANPPTRSNCLYCGGALETSVALAVVPSTPLLPQFEPEQRSLFHVVIANPNVDGSALASLATTSNLTTAELNLVLSSSATGSPLCSRVDETQTEKICERLRGSSVEAIAISDQALKLDIEPRELRTLEFTDESLVATGRRDNEKVAVTWNDVTLIVAGRLHIKTVETEEKRGRRRSRTLDQRELSTDEAVLDIYVRTDDLGWRIKSGSFDFSCLGENKSITAFENYAALTNALRDRAAHADFDDSYNRLRSVLAKIWPVEERKSSTERRRTATRNFHATKTSSDNMREFTRYSRMRQFLKGRELDKV